MVKDILETAKILVTSKHSKKIGIILLLLLFILIVLFPYIDANFTFHYRIEKRIENLDNLVKLSGLPLSETPQLLSEYNQILEEIEKAQTKTLSSILYDVYEIDLFSVDFWFKFISGALVPAVFSLGGLTVKGDRFISFIIPFLFALFLGFIFSMFPTLGYLWVNVAIAPTIELIFLFKHLKD